ncbi:hypothetical protein ABMZ76_08465 [Morganella morganii]|uniref:hypothetical protein n=1 Tax=Morganella morganii TaxID=582 RepID=UPI001BDA16C7|nr:hypothetical protein [Morganella morganii]MBT0317616.1 hypothetical protein [Morganella morganii subsp. morganii]
MDISSVVKSMDWGLTVAVLSLVFTGIVSFITIRYTKKSLDYTKESVQIADASLKAARESINTSVEIYEKQKKDDLIKREKEDGLKLFSIKTMIMEEIKDEFLHFVRVNKILKDIVDCNSDFNVNVLNISGITLVEYESPDSEPYSGIYKEPSYDICKNFLLDTLILDPIVAKKIINLNESSYIYKSSMSLIMSGLSDNKKNEIKYLLSNIIDRVADYKKSMEELYESCSDDTTKALSLYENSVI